MTATLDLSTLDEDVRYTVVEIRSLVLRGAGNIRLVAYALGSDPDDERFREAWQAALDHDLIRYTPGCCDGGHDYGCEVEAL